MLMKIALFYYYFNIVVFQHLCFNNKTSSAHSSRMPLSHYLTFLLRLVFVLIHFRARIANFFSLFSYEAITWRWWTSDDWKYYFFLFFSFRYVCWGVCIAANFHEIKSGAYCVLKFRVNFVQRKFYSRCGHASLIFYNKINLLCIHTR